MEITYKDRLFIADNPVEMIINLKKEYGDSISYRAIAKAVGYSRTHVMNILNKFGLTEHSTDIDENLFDYWDDEAISSLTGIPMTKTSVLRKKHLSKKNNIINLSRRRRYLAQFLFGARYRPGPNFVTYMKEIISELPEKQKEAIRIFYLEGFSESRSSEVNSDTYRPYRARIREQLKLQLKEIDAKELLEKGVLLNGVTKGH